jgi:DNA-binding SARP family transcriptional activator
MLASQQFVAQQFHELTDDVRLVLLHPNYVQQHLTLNTILEDKASVYVSFQGTHLTETQLDQQLNEALARQTPNASLDGVSVLALDECDRAEPAEFDRFLVNLLPRMTKGRVVILSRLMPRTILDNENLCKQTRFIPADESRMLWDYARHDGTSGSLLEVRALGSGRVLLNGVPVDSWDGLLPRSLFFYLVDRGMTTRGEIFETFWPTLSTREATNVFHVTKRKISEVLGMDLTTYWSGFYHISPHIHLSYDAALFSETVQDSAVVSPDESTALLRRAISLYRGDFLTSVDMAWSQKRREELLQTYGEALVGLAKSTERNGELRHALGYYLRAAMTNRQREDLALSIMRLYREMGMHKDALTIYTRLEEELKQQLGVSPAPNLQELAAAIRAELDGKV